MDYFCHKSSCVDKGASIGSGSKIWHFTHISEKSKIGKNCSIGQNVYIANKVVIGNGVKIQNNVSVYDDVTLEDDVFCGPSMVFTNVINPRAFIERKNEYKKTIVRRGASLGANSTIICGVEIGEYSLVGAGALVNKDIKPYSLVVGIPSKQIGWVSKSGIRLDLPITGNGHAICRDSNTKYILKDSKVYCEEL